MKEKHSIRIIVIALLIAAAIAIGLKLRTFGISMAFWGTISLSVYTVVFFVYQVIAYPTRNPKV